jgi:hypothetical protein
MKEIYPKTLNMDAVVADPRIMGLVREEGGKMYDFTSSREREKGHQGGLW